MGRIFFIIIIFLRGFSACEVGRGESQQSDQLTDLGRRRGSKGEVQGMVIM